MRPKRPNRPPITLWDLRNGRVPMVIRCNCGHRAEISPFSFSAPDEMPILELKGRLRCVRCGSRAGIDIGPQPVAWVVYLDETGQHHRQPFYAGMVRGALARERGED